jgi:hypothetical protein
VSTGVTALAVSARYRHTCAVTAANQVLCWGENSDGQVDPVGFMSSNSPVPWPSQVGGTGAAVGVATGGYHTCAWDDAGKLLCWGRSADGQLGFGTGSPPPGLVQPSLPENVKVASAGSRHTCALGLSGAVYCWGDSVAVLPQLVSLPRPATRLVSGDYHDCAILDDYTLQCWGWNRFGQLGQGSWEDSTFPVVAVSMCP